MDDTLVFIVVYALFLISLLLNIILYLKNRKLVEINKYYADMYADCTEILADLVVKDDDFSKYLDDDEADKDGYDVELVENRPKTA